MVGKERGEVKIKKTSVLVGKGKGAKVGVLIDGKKKARRAKSEGNGN